MFKPVLIVPIFNHLVLFREFSKKLTGTGTPILVVDDGSDDGNDVDQFCANAGFFYLRHPKNLGKGAALKSGLVWAKQHDFSHALQIDADGQHNPDDIRKFLDEARKFPTALINSVPVYDDSAPRSRTQGRKITNFWVMLETRSRTFGDAMCGFRVYPLAGTDAILKKLSCARMGGDIEILVRFIWAGIPVRKLPTRVLYPKNGISHFRVFADNWRLSLLHTKLFCLSLLWRKK